MYSKTYREPNTVRIYFPKKHYEFKELAAIAYEKQSGKIKAFGRDALKEVYVEDEMFEVTSFISNERVTDFAIAEKALRAWINNVEKELQIKHIFKKRVVAFCTGSEPLTPVEAKVYQDLGFCMKAKEIGVYERTFADFNLLAGELNSKGMDKYDIVISFE